MCDWLKIGEQGAGFTNQMFILTTGIIRALRQNKHTIICDRYVSHCGSKMEIPLSETLDLNAFNAFLKSKCNIRIIDKTLLSVQVTYGNVDISHLWLPKVPFCTNLNIIAGDPAPGVVKQLIIKYFMNNELIVSYSYDEYNRPDIITPPSGYSPLDVGGIWIHSYSIEIFEDIMRNITFHSRFQSYASKWLAEANIPLSSPANVIHTRLEDDRQHWAKQSNITLTEFTVKLENIYIDSIRTHFDKVTPIIVLCFNYDNRVITYLKDNGYNYFCPQKYSHIGRDENAIIDFLIATRAGKGGKFIGNFNFDNIGSGSTFSYYIHLIMNPSTYVTVDLDKLS